MDGDFACIGIAVAAGELEIIIIGRLGVSVCEFRNFEASKIAVSSTLFMEVNGGILHEWPDACSWIMKATRFPTLRYIYQCMF